MKPNLALAPALAFLVLAATTLGAEEAIAPKERMNLFNGRDFTGWKLFLPGDADVNKTWSIQDGVIRCMGKPAGYMRTEQDYRDYKLTVEWRFLKPGNTGVLLHMSGPDKVWPRSIEAQGKFGDQGDFWVIDGTEFKEHRGVEGRRVPKQGVASEKPAGEWNTYEIVCKGDSIRVFVNGKLMNTATECNVTSGKICIQSEGSEIEIRKVFVEPAA
jgi:hypothetical protein